MKVTQRRAGLCATALILPASFNAARIAGGEMLAGI
jgi:hypothetical protein